VSPAALPADWLERLARVPATARREQLTDFVAPETGGRASAVLVLFGVGDDGEPDVLLTQRSDSLPSHAGQVSFPGGSINPDDDGPVDAALREAAEEAGVRREGVEVLGQLPEIFLPPSGFVVTSVLAWWREPSPVSAVDLSEVARVERVPLVDLIDPDNRVMARHPSGLLGPAFTVRGLFVWGFTARLLSALLDLAGLARPWHVERVVDLPANVVALLP
jgi:8-oxo-dGTP pyrophosphatase MutT (NUDIX family)